MKERYTRTEYLRDQAFAGYLCLSIGFFLGMVFAAGTAVMIAGGITGSEALFWIGCAAYVVGALLGTTCLCLIDVKRREASDEASKSQPAGG